MATASQIKTLIRSHYDADCESFLTAALQVAAHEARQGHTALAQEIRSLIQQEIIAKTQIDTQILTTIPAEV